MNKFKYRTIIIIAVAVITFIIFAGVVIPRFIPPTAEITTAPTSIAEIGWRQFLLTDVRSGDKFTLEDFAGQTVLLQSFATWCPACRNQQVEMSRLKKGNHDIVLVSLDTDPNENRNQAIELLAANGFDWYFAVSPLDYTRELTDVFGIGFANVPALPIALICPDGSSRLLDRGLKTANELATEINQGCTDE